MWLQVWIWRSLIQEYWQRAREGRQLSGVFISYGCLLSHYCECRDVVISVIWMSTVRKLTLWLSQPSPPVIGYRSKQKSETAVLLIIIGSTDMGYIAPLSYQSVPICQPLPMPLSFGIPKLAEIHVLLVRLIWYNTKLISLYASIQNQRENFVQRECCENWNIDSCQRNCVLWTFEDVDPISH